MKLKSKMLLKAADSLAHDENSLGYTFMCWALRGQTNCSATLQEFNDILIEQAIVDHPGASMVDFKIPRGRDYGSYRQSVRFMFLEFLAYQLQDEETA